MNRHSEFLRSEATSGGGRWNDMMTAAADEIDRLANIESAARNLAAQKGRHNTEIAYKRLCDALANNMEFRGDGQR